MLSTFGLATPFLRPPCFFGRLIFASLPQGLDSSLFFGFFPSRWRTIDCLSSYSSIASLQCFRSECDRQVRH